MNYTLVGIAMLMVSVPVVFGETFEIETPWNESSGHGCHLNPFNEDQYLCTFDRYPTPMTLEELEEFKEVLTPEQYEEAMEDIIEQEEEVVEDVVSTPPQTPNERLVERLMNIDNPSEADLATIRALENLNDVCELGIEEGARIQNFASFELPDRSVNLDGSFSLSTYPQLSKILMKIQECTYWNEYRAKYLAQYNDIELDDQDDLAVRLGIGELQSTYDYHPYFKTVIDQDAKDAQELVSKIDGCNNDYWGNNLKIQNGCNLDFGYEATLATPPMKDYANNSIWKQYMKFQNGETSEQLNKNIRESKDSHDKQHYGGQYP